MSRLFTIDIDGHFRTRLAKLTEDLNKGLKTTIQQATKNLAEAAYAKAHELANDRLNSTAQQYTDALKYEEVEEGVYSVSLDDSAAHLEDGYPRYDMKPGLLKNAKKRSKRGFRYRTIPFKQGKEGGKSGGSLAADLNRLRGGLGDQGLTRGPDGQPLLGKVFGITRNDVGVWALNPKQSGVSATQQRFADPEPSKNLSGLTKYQYSQKLRGGGSRVRSSYMTFRTVSEDPRYAARWIHPGYAGIHVFPDLYQWAEQQAARMLEDILGR